MPYVPSFKTVPPAEDRKLLDPAVEVVAQNAAKRIINNNNLFSVYQNIFGETCCFINLFLQYSDATTDDGNSGCSNLARTIVNLGDKYGYDGAYLGEFNYAITRFIQRVPQIKVERGDWDQELRYWIYARTVAALVFVIKEGVTRFDLLGVLEDIKDEYKWKVNRAYEAAQIIKSGDCYDTPYYTRLIEVIDQNGNHIGFVDIFLKRSEATVNKDVLDGRIVLKM